MMEWVYRSWPEVKGQSAERAEVRPGDDDKLAVPTLQITINMLIQRSAVTSVL